MKVAVLLFHLDCLKLAMQSMSPEETNVLCEQEKTV